MILIARTHRCSHSLDEGVGSYGGLRRARDEQGKVVRVRRSDTEWARTTQVRVVGSTIRNDCPRSGSRRMQRQHRSYRQFQCQPWMSRSKHQIFSMEHQTVAAVPWRARAAAMTTTITATFAWTRSVSTAAASRTCSSSSRHVLNREPADLV